MPDRKPPAARRRPNQARSRERFDDILRATADLIAERGIEPISMTDIAKRSDMGLTALYRYFPNKAAIVRELALQNFARDDEALIDNNADRSVDPATRLKTGIEEYWQRHVDEPHRVHLRAAVRSDQELATLDFADTRRQAAHIADSQAAALGVTDLATLERRTHLVLELLDSLMRVLAQLQPDEIESYIDDFVEMAMTITNSDSANASTRTP